MFKGKLSTLKNFIYLMILGLHAFLFAYFFYYTWFNYMSIIISLSSVGLVTLALYSFLTTKSYYYYFYFGIILGSIPLVFVIHISGVLIVPEVIILLMLMYRGLTIDETYIKIYEAGLTNILPTLTTVDVVPKDLSKTKEVRNPESTTPIKNEDKNIEQKKQSLKMLAVNLLLTTTFFISSIISISLSQI